MSIGDSQNTALSKKVRPTITLQKIIELDDPHLHLLNAAEINLKSNLKKSGMDSFGRRNDSVPIIDSKFCMPDTVHLTVKHKKKIFRSSFFIVLDTDGNQLLKIVKNDSLKNINRILLDATSSPSPRFAISFSWHHVWRVYRGKNTNDKDGLFRVKRKNGFTLKVFMGSESSKEDKQKKSDFDIVGFLPRFYMNDTMIADVNSKFSWGEDGMEKGFKIRVSAGIDYAFIICLIIIHGEMAEANKAPVIKIRE